MFVKICSWHLYTTHGLSYTPTQGILNIYTHRAFFFTNTHSTHHNHHTTSKEYTPHSTLHPQHPTLQTPYKPYHQCTIIHIRVGVNLKKKRALGKLCNKNFIITISKFHFLMLVFNFSPGVMCFVDV